MNEIELENLVLRDILNSLPFMSVPKDLTSADGEGSVIFLNWELMEKINKAKMMIYDSRLEKIIEEKKKRVGIRD